MKMRGHYLTVPLRTGGVCVFQLGGPRVCGQGITETWSEELKTAAPWRARSITDMGNGCTDAAPWSSLQDSEAVNRTG